MEAGDRALQGADPGGHRVGDADPRRRGIVAGRREGNRGEGDAGDQDRDEICAFCEQARNRGGISGSRNVIALTLLTQ